MKKALIILFAFCMMGTAFAQVSFGPKAGVTFSKYGFMFASWDSGGMTKLQAEVNDNDSYAADHKYANRTVFLSATWMFDKKQ
ncbi:MAG: hypothetical protein ABFS05_13170 [Bacteroidota bacterium]